MKAQGTIERELRRVKKAKELAYFLNETAAQDELYGAQQALSWALGENAMAPAKAFSIKARESA